MSGSSRLFDPLPIGPANLQHRLVLAPLTRYRADDDHVPLPFVPEYYSQRGSLPGTLLIAEGTFIHPRAGGYRNVPGIYNAEQITAWKKITDEVHAKGSFIYLQLWALGRAADPVVAKAEGIELLGPSAMPMRPEAAVPKEMTKSDIQDFISYYAQAGKNAIEAGFDGVELHGANGYLIDQFLRDVSNSRTDEYGGSIENRSRFGLEAVKAVIEAIGAERVGIRFNPYSRFQGMGMENPVPQFSHIIENLKQFNLSYIHLVRGRIADNADVEHVDSIDFAIRLWGPERPLLINGGYKPDSAKRLVDEEYENYNIAVVFGRYWITTPDLAFRVKHGIELTPYERAKFYTPKSPEGYIDYPFSAEFLKAQAGLSPPLLNLN
ncbi:hypothetical protein FQN55_009619 [Onygenales sp. PD_40]|nr:hypothetical protein FQN55_009619 [Onygenales sp. PD_40]KAK2792908.1 hypothetical protein FQN52_002586 [Onygenales sp. PD_12]KAK2805880.1 hypothetical protein FQN51_008654 [Onygenales sp. PD_10]